MFGGISYIVRLMRGAESLLGTENEYVLQSVVAKITDRLAAEHNAHEALQTLSRVAQFERIAIMLMWELHRWQLQGGEVAPEVVSHDVQALRKTIVNSLRRSGGKKQGQFTLPPYSPALRTFYLRLRECNRQIDLLGHGAGEGLIVEKHSQDHLSGVLNSAMMLRDSAMRIGREDIIRFTLVFVNFLKYVLRNKLFGDVRVLNILENTGSTLQSVMDSDASPGALSDATELLENPETLLQPTFQTGYQEA